VPANKEEETEHRPRHSDSKTPGPKDTQAIPNSSEHHIQRSLEPSGRDCSIPNRLVSSDRRPERLLCDMGRIDFEDNFLKTVLIGNSVN
jgi:hypothetical protein